MESADDASYADAMLKADITRWDGIEPSETEPQRQARILRERAILVQAEADIDAGLGIDLLDLDAWFDALDKNENAPCPLPRGVS